MVLNATSNPTRYTTQVMVMSNGTTYLSYFANNKLSACYAGRFGWWPSYVLKFATEKAVPSLVPWQPSTTQYSFLVPRSTYTFTWLNADNTQRQWQPVRALMQHPRATV